MAGETETKIGGVNVRRVDLFERFLQANQVAIFVAVCVLAYFMTEINAIIVAMEGRVIAHESIEGHPLMVQRQVSQEDLLLQISNQIEVTNNRFAAFALDYEIGALISERRDIRLEMLILPPDDSQRARYRSEIEDIEEELRISRMARASYIIEAGGNNYRNRDN